MRPSDPSLICDICGRVFSDSDQPLVCPGCGVIGAFSWHAVQDAETRLATETPSLATPCAPLRIVPTGLSFVDELLSGGFAETTTTTLYGPRGCGKSTLALAVAGGLAATLETRGLVVCPEMGREILVRTSERVPRGRDRLFASETPLSWMQEARAMKARILVVDSVSRFPRPVEALHQAIEWAKRARGIAICLTHQSRKGRPLGPVGLEHDPDAVLKVTKSRGVRRLAIDGKCRWAAEGPSVRIPAF